VDFPDYGADELLAIAGLFLERLGYELGPGARDALREYVVRRMAQPRFGNARSIRNALDRARLRQARRLVRSGGAVDGRALSTISAEDIRQSRVMAGGTPAAEPFRSPLFGTRSLFIEFSRTHVNFQRVPTVDTSNPFAARDIPTADVSFLVVRFATRRASTSPGCSRCCTTRSCRGRTRSSCPAGRCRSRCSSS